jgi:transketolase
MDHNHAGRVAGIVDPAGPHRREPDGFPIDVLCINTIRTLSMDAVQQANSGDPGAPMGLAAVAYTLWQQVLRNEPAEPNWPNCDRFVLSNGHASMLLYSLLHLAWVKDAARGGSPMILIGTGSEVQLCIQAYEALKQEGVVARVVSMPCWGPIRAAGSGPLRQRLAAGGEGAGVGGGGLGDRLGPLCRLGRRHQGMHTLGSSAPIKDLMKKFGFTPEKVLAAAKEQIAKVSEAKEATK